MIRPLSFSRLRAALCLCVLAFLCAGPALAQFPESTAERIRSIRSVTYYNYGIDWSKFDLAEYEKALDDIKQIGGNGVWLVLPWKSFQPVALPKAQWNEEAFKKLDQAVAAAEKRGMNAILPLCYLGPGWEPQGLDARVWTLDTQMYEAFSRYALEMIDRLSAHRNMLFLLYTEGCEPYIDSVRDYPLAVESFRKWCQSVNPSVKYWNERWGKDYKSWDEVQPIGYKTGDANSFRFDDHWRWCAAVLRERHGPLARQIHEKIKGRALLGYHDYSLIAQDWAKGESPIPPDTPCDFLSIAGYYGLSNTPIERFKADMPKVVERCQTRYPQLPLAMLETGAAAYEVGFREQAEAMDYIIDLAKKKGFGLNFWMYKDFECPELSQASFGLYTPQGKAKPSYEVLKKAWEDKTPKAKDKPAAGELAKQ